MRVEYTAQGGRVTERFRVDFTAREMETLADLARSFPKALSDDDPFHSALQRVAREWRVDQEIQPSLTADREAA